MSWIKAARMAGTGLVVLSGAVLPGSDEKQLLLSRCVFRGVWLRQPEPTSADDKGGSK